jgi:hypothetical protein
MKNRVLSIGLIIVVLNASQLLAAEGLKENVYIKGAIGYGGGKDVSLFMWTEDNKEVKTSAGGGRNMEGGAGYKFNPNQAIEFGFGYQKSSEDLELSNGDSYFKRVPLTITYIHQIPSSSSYRLYLGGGGGIYLSPELYREGPGIETICKYKSSFGPHGLIGIVYKLNTFPIFCELKYVLIKYKFKEGEENGIILTPDNTNPIIWNAWKELNGNQWIFNIGIKSLF